MKKRNKTNEAEREKKADAIRKLEIDQMAEHKPSDNASKWFRRPAYQVGRLIRRQGEQIRGDANDGA